MPDLDDLKAYYATFEWRTTEAAWGDRWGGTDMQWYGTILPRVHAFLPASNVLEIGPGQGRLSRYLRPHCERLYLADMTPHAVEACQTLFSRDRGVNAILVDGASLAAVSENRFDFVISVFSLVHADAATMQALIRDLATLLSPDGVAFIHHSNAGACLTGNAQQDGQLDYYRSTSTSAETVRQASREAGLSCCSQELLGWETPSALTDCFSIIVRRYSMWDHPYRCIRNGGFVDEVIKIKELSMLYGRRAPSLPPMANGNGARDPLP